VAVGMTETRVVLGAHHFELTSFYERTRTRSFEKYYDPTAVVSWMRRNPLLPVATCLAYIVLIVLGQHYFSTRERLNWRRTLAAWNFGLSLFSFIGVLRTGPQLLHNLYTYSLKENFCLDPRATYGSGITGLWVQLFILSKFP